MGGFSEKHVELTKEIKTGELLASWVVSVGDQDQVIHIWKYTGGYAGVDTAFKTLKHNSVIYVQSSVFYLYFHTNKYNNACIIWTDYTLVDYV